jgi:general secretion pathway protein D
VPLRRVRTGSRTFVVLGAAIILACGASGCSEGVLEQRTDVPQDVTDVVKAADLRPRSPIAVAEPGAGAQPKGFSIFGSAEPAQTATAYASTADGDVGAVQADPKDGFTLNFESAPVANVAKAVLGDILGVGYVVDPRAQGSISLSTGRPIAKKDVLFVLESALRANNLVLLREAGVYRIAPTGDGSVGALDSGAEAQAGYGVSAIPLHYVSGPNIARLLEGFSARPGTIRSDPSGTLLLVTGTGAERQQAIDTVRSFDVDWMRGQSVGLVPVQNSEPEPVVAELEKIMDSGEGGMGRGLVKFQAVARQNAILVVAAQPGLLQSATRWIQRLDSPNAASQGVKVYKLRYGDAKQIAQLLNNIFVSGGGGGGATSAVAPNAGETTLTPSERLTGGKPKTGVEAAAAAQGAPQGETAPAGAFGGIPTAALANALEGGGGGNGAVLPGVRIAADEANNAVLVYATPESYRIIERAIDQLDRPKQQVAIEVTIAEVTLNDQLNYGVQFYLSGKLGAIINSSTGKPVPVTDAPQGFNVFIGNNATPHAIINALHDLTAVKILSNPSLVVVDNGEATLQVGDQVPVTTGSATVLSTSNTVVNTVDYKNTGIILHVQPRISPNGTVSLGIEQEISNVPQNEVNTTLTPTISQRRVKSTISVVDGQMVLLAGLINDTGQNSRQGVPILDQLPYVGGAFSTTGVSDVRTELIMLIRPKIIRDGVDASQVAEELRAKMRNGRIPATSLPAALNVNARPLQ